jgi:hypothetical protein
MEGDGLPPESQDIFYVAAAARINGFMDDRTGAPIDVSDDELREAALVVIAARHEDDPAFPSPEDGARTWCNR